jgi:hypothetical protein
MNREMRFQKLSYFIVNCFKIAAKADTSPLVKSVFCQMTLTDCFIIQWPVKGTNATNDHSRLQCSFCFSSSCT